MNQPDDMSITLEELPEAPVTFSPDALRAVFVDFIASLHTLSPSGAFLSRSNVERAVWALYDALIGAMK